MTEYIMTTLEYFLRIVLAGLCGGIIGYERKNRGKEAGIRTHIIVAIASALMMLVSKYGFNDLAFGEDFRLDPSRIASQIVSGVGFLGAGMIFVQKRAVMGLTTAAGIWATSGIGMAIGSGMYTIGILSAAVIIIVQVVMHKNLKFLHQHDEKHIQLSLNDSPETITYIKDYLKLLDIQVTEMEISSAENSVIDIEVTAIVPHDFDMFRFLDYDRQYITAVKI